MCFAHVSLGRCDLCASGGWGVRRGLLRCAASASVRNRDSVPMAFWTSSSHRRTTQPPWRLPSPPAAHACRSAPFPAWGTEHQPPDVPCGGHAGCRAGQAHRRARSWLGRVVNDATLLPPHLLPAACAGRPGRSLRRAAGSHSASNVSAGCSPLRPTPTRRCTKAVAAQSCVCGH